MFFSRPSGHKFVSRGDPSVVDFDKDDLTSDGGYHDLDLSAIIPKNTKLILLRVKCESSLGTLDLMVRKKGNTNEINSDYNIIAITDVPSYQTLLVVPNNDRVIEYKTTFGTYTVLNITVGGWFV